MKHIEDYKNHMATKGMSDITIKNFDWRIKFLQKFLKDRNHDVVTSQSLEDYAYFLKEEYLTDKGEKLSYSSIKSRLVAVRGYCKYAVERGEYLFNPSTRIQCPRDKAQSRNVPSQKVIQKFLDNLPMRTPEQIRTKSIMEMFYSTGIRASELLGLDIYDIDFDSSLVRIRNGKGGKERMVPIGKHARLAVKKYLNDARPRLMRKGKSTALFLSAQGNRLTYKMLGWNFRNARGGQRFTLHSFRHACAVGMLQNGADIRYIQELLGHESLTTTQVYLKSTTDDVRRTFMKYHPRCNYEK